MGLEKLCDEWTRVYQPHVLCMVFLQRNHDQCRDGNNTAGCAFKVDHALIQTNYLVLDVPDVGSDGDKGIWVSLEEIL